MLSWLGFSSGNNHRPTDGSAETLLGCTNGQAEKENIGTVWCGCRSTRELNCCCVQRRDSTLQVPMVWCLHFLLVFVSLPWSWGFCQTPVQSRAAAASSQPSFWWGSQQGRLENVTWSNEKIHKAPVMLPLACFSVSLGGCHFRAEFSPLWGTLGRELWLKVLPSLLAHAEDKKGSLLLLRLPKPRGYCGRMLRRTSLFGCPSRWELGGSVSSRGVNTAVGRTLLRCPCRLVASWRSKALLLCLFGRR